MNSIVRLFLIMVVVAGGPMALSAQDLPAGTKVLAQTNTDVKFHPATVVKKALDGYTVKFEDGSVQDVLQADLAFATAPEAGKLTIDTKVAANSFGDLYPGRIYEIGDGGNFSVAWESGGTEMVSLENIYLRMAPRTDPRPTPVAVTPAPVSQPVGPNNLAAAPAKPAPVANLPATSAPQPMAGSDEDNPLAAILGMAGDRFLMSYSQVAPTKSTTLAAKTDLADVSLTIPEDYIPVGLDFTVKNKTGKALTVDWSKCYVTSFAGVKHGVYHVDYRALEDLPAVEKATDVAAGAEQKFSLFSRDGLVTTVHPAAYDDKGVWQPKWTEILNTNLFYGADLPNALSHGTSQADQAKDLELKRKNVLGKTFKVGFALVSAGKPSLVEFTVRIDDLKKTHEGNMLDTIGK